MGYLQITSSLLLVSPSLEMEQQFTPQPQPPQYVPITFPNTTNARFKLVSQCCGTAISLFFAVFSLLTVAAEIYTAMEQKSISIRLQHFASAFAALFYLYFFVESVRVPEFLAGKPDMKRFLAPTANFLIHLITDFCMGVKGPDPKFLFDPLNLVLFLACLAIYSQEDAKESCLLCFKPWVYKMNQVEVVNVPIPTPIQLPSSVTAAAYPTVPFTYPGYNSQAQIIIK